MPPVIKVWQENAAQLANLMTPAIRTAAETAARMQIELQPLLRELYETRPTAIEFSSLVQNISQYADEIDFSSDTYEIGRLTEEDKQEVSKAVSEILAQPDNWEHKLVKSLASFQECHPVYSKAIIGILGALITIILSVSANYLYDTIKTAKLREKPSQDSPVITVINVSQTVNIIDDTPYYFEIQYTDSQTGDNFRGWISKRSVREHTEDESEKN